MVIAPTCPNVSLNPEARFGYMDGRSICIMSFSRWQKLMARITLKTVAPADNGAATPSGTSGASIFSFFIGSRYDTTATENARIPSWQPVDSSMQSLPGGSELSRSFRDSNPDGEFRHENRRDCVVSSFASFHRRLGFTPAGSRGVRRTLPVRFGILDEGFQLCGYGQAGPAFDV